MLSNNLDYKYITGQPDPYVIHENGRFYLYATHNDGITLFVSDDMENWSCRGFVLTEKKETAFWAPAVFKCDGQYYLYYSSVPVGCQDSHEECLKVAAADSPEGPFTYIGTLLPPFSIDAHVVTYRGQMYLFYSTNIWSGNRVGTIIVLDRLTNPFTAEGRPQPVLLPTLEQEVSWPARDFGDGKPFVKWHTVEGAFYFYKDGVHYLMYSGNAFQNDNYFVGYATSRDECEDLRDVRFTKYPDDKTFQPLLFRDGVQEGTGHNSVLRYNGAYYIFYHARTVDIPDDGTDCRSLRINRLTAEDGILTVGEPIPTNLE